MKLNEAPRENGLILSAFVCGNNMIVHDGRDHGPHMNLTEVLNKTKPDDNPIKVVVHVKQ
jgi:hypothetical protein